MSHQRKPRSLKLSCFHAAKTVTDIKTEVEELGLRAKTRPTDTRDEVVAELQAAWKSLSAAHQHLRNAYKAAE